MLTGANRKRGRQAKLCRLLKKGTDGRWRRRQDYSKGVTSIGNTSCRNQNGQERWADPLLSARMKRIAGRSGRRVRPIRLIRAMQWWDAAARGSAGQPAPSRRPKVQAFVAFSASRSNRVCVSPEPFHRRSVLHEQATASAIAVTIAMQFLVTQRHTVSREGLKFTAGAEGPQTTASWAISASGAPLLVLANQRQHAPTLTHSFAG